MLSVKKLTQSAQECIGWPYVSPGSNGPDGIDCSGLFVKMFKDQGAKIYHGSNTIFHEYCSETGVITSVDQLQEGMAVFKVKAWTPDQKDNRWYGKMPGNVSHIGYVESVNPLRIIQASSVAGYVTTTESLARWAYWGKLKDVDYSVDTHGSSEEPEQEPVVERKYAIATSENGKPINMRAEPSTDCRLYDPLPVGTKVELTGVEKKGWKQVNYYFRKGWWIMSKFLKEEYEDDDWYYDDVEPPVNVEGPYTVVIEWISEEEAKKIKEQYPKARITVG